jgi:hypothetical protein
MQKAAAGVDQQACERWDQSRSRQAALKHHWHRRPAGRHLTLALQGSLLALHGNERLALKLCGGALAKASLQAVGAQGLAQQQLLLGLLLGRRLVLEALLRLLQRLQAGIAAAAQESGGQGGIDAAAAAAHAAQPAAGAHARGGCRGCLAEVELLLQCQVVQLALQQLVLLGGSEALRGTAERIRLVQQVLVLLQQGRILLLLQQVGARGGSLLLLLLQQSMLQQGCILGGEVAKVGLLLLLTLQRLQGKDRGTGRRRQQAGG